MTGWMKMNFIEILEDLKIEPGAIVREETETSAAPADVSSESK